MRVTSVVPVSSGNVTVVLTCEACAPGCAYCTSDAPTDCVSCLDAYIAQSDHSCIERTFANVLLVHFRLQSSGVLTLIVVCLCVASLAIFVMVWAALQHADCCRRKPAVYHMVSSSDDSDIENFTQTAVKYSKNGANHSVKIPVVSVFRDDIEHTAATPPRNDLVKPQTARLPNGSGGGGDRKSPEKQSLLNHEGGEE